MAAIFWLSSLPGDTIPLPGFRFSDKAVHFAAYAVLGILIGIRHALRRRLEGRPAAAPPGPPRFDRAGALIGILYGFSDELHQAFVPLREPSLGDFAADALGVAVGIWLTRRLAAAGGHRGSGGARSASPPGRRLSEV